MLNLVKMASVAWSSFRLDQDVCALQRKYDHSKRLQWRRCGEKGGTAGNCRPFAGRDFLFSEVNSQVKMKPKNAPRPTGKFTCARGCFRNRKNSIFGIIGMSGAGKSTLLRALVGLERWTAEGFMSTGSKSPVSGRGIEELFKECGRRVPGLQSPYQHNAERNMPFRWKSAAGIKKESKRGRVFA